jgi:hypothetical protein
MKFIVKLICLSYIYLVLASHALATSETIHRSLRLGRKLKKIKYSDTGIDKPVVINEKSDIEMIKDEDVYGKVQSNIITGAPFAIILKKVKNFFPSCHKFNKKAQMTEENQRKCREKISEADGLVDDIRSMSIDEAAEIFANLKITNIEDYWYWYYILSNVALRGKGKRGSEVGEIWRFDSKSQINTNLKDYENEQAKLSLKKLKINSKAFSDKINKFKNQTLLDLKAKVNDNDIKYREWIGDKKRSTLELRDFEHNFSFVQLIQKTNFYKIIESEFPKGVIHHFHWAAGLSSNSISNEVLKYVSDDLHTQSALLRIDIFIKDKTIKVVKNSTPNKYFNKTVPRFFIIDNFTKTANDYNDAKYKDTIEHFKAHTIKDGKCMDYISPLLTKQDKAITPFPKDNNLLFYTYLENCAEAFLYVNEKKKQSIMTPALTEKFEKKFLNLDSDFKTYLEKESNILKTNAELMESYLPDSYTDKIKNYKEQLSAAVWYLFENIFSMIRPLLFTPGIYENLDGIITDAWKKQKVLGVEYRQSNDNNLPQMIKDLKTKEVLYAFQAPGIKSRGITTNRLQSILWPDVKENALVDFKTKNSLDNLSDEEIKKKFYFANRVSKDSHYSGIDFFGYEDDPFNGARNFFPLSLQKVLKKSEIKVEKGKIQLINLDAEKSKKVEEETKKEEEEIKEENMKPNNEKVTDQSNIRSVGNIPDKIDRFTPVYHTLENADIFLHAGETSFFPDHPVDDAFLNRYYVNDNLFHAALLPHVKRVGHGFAVSRNDLIQAIYMKKNISLETCPMSNETLRYYYTFEHPFPKLLRKGMKISISPDDPGFFGYEGVNVDWFKIFMETNIKPEEAYYLVRDSIEKASDIMFGDTDAKAFEEKQKAIAKAAEEIVRFYEGLSVSNDEVNSPQIDEETKTKRIESAKVIHNALINKVKTNSIYFKENPDIDVETSVYNQKEIRKIINSKTTNPTDSQPTTKTKVKRRLK